MKYLLTCVLMLSVLAALAVGAGEKQAIKVTKVEGKTITMDAGSVHGVKVGLKGRVYYIITIGGQDKNIYIAEIKVTSVKSDESIARIEKQSAEVKPGYFVEIEGIERGKGFLYVTSSPAGADIYLDGEATGKKTPAQLEVSPGEHQVEVRMSGFLTQSKSASVAKNEVSRVEFSLTRGKGALTVMSEPMEAEVYLDGTLKGNAPITIKDITTGEHELKLHKQGYAPHTETIQIAIGEPLVLQRTLEVGKPVMKVTPQQIKLDDEHLERKIMISNQGNVPLNWSASSSARWLRITPTSGTVAPGMSIQPAMSASGELKPGQYNTVARISGEGVSSVSVQMELSLKSQDMVLIPAGAFQMGSYTYGDERPVHTVYLDAFHIDKYEVTNAQYKEFVDANPQWRKDRIPNKYHDGDYLKDWRGNSYPAGKSNYPVVYVSWYAANAYAKWAGKRLPTEAKWEKAARGGLVGKRYPWGDSISRNDANYSGTGGKDRWKETSPVGRFSPNGYGLYDLSGNVWEWCSDWYAKDYYGKSPARNPKGPRSGIWQVIRGGSWYNRTGFLRCADRYYSSLIKTDNDIGFRCGMSRSD